MNLKGESPLNRGDWRCNKLSSHEKMDLTLNVVVSDRIEW